jgi:dimethylargininase
MAWMKGSHMCATQAIVRTPARSLARGITTQNLGAPDVDLAREQHVAYVAALRQLGVEVTVLDADEAYPDSCFVEDPALIFNGVAIITRPAARSRSGEVEAIRETLAALMPTMELGGGDDVRLDGGDVLCCGTHILVGQSRRTNHMGLKRLTARLREVDPALTVTGVPISGVLHLKTGLTALRERLLLRDPHCKMESRFPFARTFVLPREQGYAANVLPLNDGIIIAKGYPLVATLAHEYYDTVIELDMSEFQRMDGSLTCLSLLW